MSFSEVVDHLRHDGVLEALTAFTVVWFLVVHAARWLLLRVFDRPRAAEIARVLGGRVVFLFLASFLVQKTLERVEELTNPGVAADFALTLVIDALRLAGGVLLALLLAALFHVLHSEFLERQLRSHSRVREKNTATLLYALVRPLGVVLAIAFVLSQFHLDLAGYLVTLGGASVALAFALQRLLTNMFAGLSLAADAPFSQNDLIRTSDDRLYEVIERGLRTTTMRDITTHDTVHFPNSVLAESPFAEVTRPTDDVRVVIDLGVPYDASLRDVRKTLHDIALGHPHVVGPFKKKEKAIQGKVARLFLRHELDECMQHWIELARLKAENDLNEAISELRWELEAQATLVDELESRGFDGAEKAELGKMAQRLRRRSAAIERLTTVWLLAVRNGVARGRFEAMYEATLESADSHVQGMPRRATSTGDHLTGALNEVEQGIVAELYREAVGDKPLDRPWPLKQLPTREEREREIAENQRRMKVLGNALTRLPERLRAESADSEEAGFYLGALRIANGLAAWVGVQPETPDMSTTYKQVQSELPHQTEDADAWKEVATAYQALGDGAVAKILDGIRDAVPDAPLEGRISVIECRSRAEDLFHSEQMVMRMIDHDWCSRTLGAVHDDDERSDLAELFRMWGDKTAELVEQLETVASHLEAGRSTTIDSELRNLASNLRMTFKDPFPLWKAPIASVEGYDESSIHLAMKVYVDNVRMDKYMRMFATLTNLRMRIVERLSNDGITLPYPRRDVLLLGSDGRPGGDAHGNGQGTWPASDVAGKEPAGPPAA